MINVDIHRMIDTRVIEEHLRHEERLARIVSSVHGIVTAADIEWRETLRHEITRRGLD